MHGPDRTPRHFATARDELSLSDERRGKDKVPVGPDPLDVHGDALEILDATFAPARPAARVLALVGAAALLVAIGIKIVAHRR